MTGQQEATIMKASIILGNQTGETISRSEAIRRMSYQMALRILKENKEE